MKKNLMKMNKRGVLENLGDLAIGAVVAGLLIVVGFLIMAQVGSNAQVTADGNATAAVTSIQDAVQDNVVGFLPLVILVVVAVLIIALVRRVKG